MWWSRTWIRSFFDLVGSGIIPPYPQIWDQVSPLSHKIFKFYFILNTGEKRGRINGNRNPFLNCSVPDPWCFDQDPDPWIHTTDLRIQILLFSSVGFKMPTKKGFSSNGRIRIRTNNHGSGTERTKKHTDPYPEHCAIKYLHVPTGLGSTTPAVYTAWKMPESRIFSFSQQIFKKSSRTYDRPDLLVLCLLLTDISKKK